MPLSVRKVGVKMEIDIRKSGLSTSEAIPTWLCALTLACDFPVRLRELMSRRKSRSIASPARRQDRAPEEVSTPRSPRSIRGPVSLRLHQTVILSDTFCFRPSQSLVPQIFNTYIYTSGDVPGTLHHRVVSLLHQPEDCMPSDCIRL